MNVPEGWNEPPEEVKAMATNLFQLFTALSAAGFTERQAIAVVGEILSSANGSAS